MTLIHRGHAAALALSMAAATVSPAVIAEVTDASTVALPALLMPKAAQAMALDLVEVGNSLVAVGDRGHVLISTDDGDSWTQKATPVRTPLIAVDFADDQNGWAVGHDTVIIHTADGGETWDLQNFEPMVDGTAGQPFYGVLAVDANTAFAVGSFGKLRMTSDAGQTWTVVDAAFTETETHINDIIQLPSGTLVAVGESGLVAVSSDLGESWSMASSPTANSFFGVIANGQNGVTAFGLQGTVLKAADVSAIATMDPDDFDPWSIEARDEAGLRDIGWTRVTSPNENTIFGGHVGANGDVVMVGQNAVIYTAKGSSLEVVQTSLNQPIAAVVARPGRIVVAAVDGLHTISIK